MVQLLSAMNGTCDVLVIGGGIVGLAIALELRSRGLTVTVLNRNTQEAATWAAAGMLAPESEGIPPGPMLDLCLQSRALYPAWVQQLEDKTDLVAGYWPCGVLVPDFVAPVPANGNGGYPQPRSNGLPGISKVAGLGSWLDREALLQFQPGLGPEVVGGRWLPEDSQVDNRALATLLLRAAQNAGVVVQEGVTVTAIQQHQHQVNQLHTTSGMWQAGHYVLATGAWLRELLPVPVVPRKGQMCCVRRPDSAPSLDRVLFGPATYLVPRRDGRIIIGATSEDVGFTPHNTPAGIQTLLQRAIRLWPTLQDYPIEGFWWGFRPTTPDELPILGPSHCANLTLATGHYRNGILLGPITGRLIADFIVGQRVDPLLPHFSWERFCTGGRGTPRPLVFPTAIADYSANGPSEPMPVLGKSSPSPALVGDRCVGADRPLVIAGRQFRSRLMTGSGKYRTQADMRQSIDASGCEIVTVAVRRVQIQAPGHEGLVEALDWTRLWMLPNTAGCKTSEEAVRVARLGREMAKLLGQEDNNFVKLEVIPDSTYLLPDPIGTLEAATQLVAEGFAVLPYINADPMLAKRLEEAGCATVMPLGSPIGSGQGIKTLANLQVIIENAKVPVVVDAGIGTPSEAAQAMELGADALLINTAIAQAQNPVVMARAMGMATEAGRLAFLAGRIPVKDKASPSSPMSGLVAKP